MAVTIRNKAVEEGIRRLVVRSGKGPSALIRELVEERLRRLEEEEPATWETEKARRRAILEEFAERARHEVTDEIRRMGREDMDALYDEEGLPR